MTKIVTFRMTGTEEGRMEEAAEKVGAHPDNFMRRAVVARTEEVLKEAEVEAEVEVVVEAETATEPEALAKTCGDLGGVTLTGKPCGRKVSEGFSRCSAHSGAEKG